jgi:hypothetical protein
VGSAPCVLGRHAGAGDVSRHQSRHGLALCRRSRAAPANRSSAARPRASTAPPAVPPRPSSAAGSASIRRPTPATAAPAGAPARAASGARPAAASSAVRPDRQSGQQGGRTVWFFCPRPTNFIARCMSIRRLTCRGGLPEQQSRIGAIPYIERHTTIHLRRYPPKQYGAAHSPRARSRAPGRARAAVREREPTLVIRTQGAHRAVVMSCRGVHR